MSKFNLKILFKIIVGILQVVIRILSDPDAPVDGDVFFDQSE